MHRDTKMYPLAEVEGTQLQVEAAVSEKLPVAAIIGEAIPQLTELLGETEELKNGEGSVPAKGNNGGKEKISTRNQFA